MTYLKIHFSKKKLLLRIKLNWFLVQITSLAKKLHFKRGKFFLYTCLFLAKNLSNFVFPSQKLPTDTAIISTHSNLPNKSAANLINFSEKPLLQCIHCTYYSNKKVVLHNYFNLSVRNDVWMAQPCPEFMSKQVEYFFFKFCGLLTMS